MTDSTAAELFTHATNLQQQNSAQAAALFQQVLQLEPNHVGALEALAGIRFHRGDLAGVVPLLQRAVELRPTEFAYVSNLGTTLAMLGRFEQAVPVFQTAASISPTNAETWLHLGLVLMESDRLDEAQAALLRAATLRPAQVPALGVLGRTMVKVGRFPEACELFKRVLDANPADHETRFALASILQRLKHIDEAIAHYNQLIAATPDHADAQFNLGKAADSQKRHTDAIACYRRVLELQPNNVDAWNNLGLALQKAGRFDEAVSAMRRALPLQPNNIVFLNNLGTALHNAGLLDEALRHHGMALELNPDYALAEWNMATIQLSRGNLHDGFRAYEARLRALMPLLTFPQPMWDGSDLSGKTILLHSEQGYGDTLHFIRYAALFSKETNVLLICQNGLHRLLRTMPALSAVYDGREMEPYFDVHCPLGGLPFRFGTSLETIPNAVPYLTADPTLAKAWEQRLKQSVKGLRVGLVWAGNPGHINDTNRSLPLAAFAKIACIEGITYLGLQKGDAANQSVPAGMHFIDMGTGLTDFAETAALISRLDLVISVDTAVAHLAGAMGKPTWVLLPEPAEWRWMLKRTDSPWYPTMRLFRQPARGDWASPLHELAEALRKFAV